MSTETVTVVDVHPARDEVAAVNLPVGCVARVHHPTGAREYPATYPGDPVIAAIPGDIAHIGRGANVSYYPRVKAIRNGRHSRNRKVWDDAARALRRHPVVYVRYEQQEYYGRLVWVAVAVRTEETS